MDTEKLLLDMHENLIVVMQAAYIEWQHGGGADAAMKWIANTLDGPGLIPLESDAFGKDAQAYFEKNRPGARDAQA